MQAVDHIFVLMLENRSFDHFFGLSGRPSIPRPTAAAFGPGASDRASFDPPHEFADVQQQIAGGAMSGFDVSAMLAFEPQQIPMISQLADEFVLFDNWHASVPGPTWPNRFFVHAASSGGLATSPTQFQAGGAVISPKSPFRFEHGSIFDRLDAAGVPWRVYHGDVHPQVLALPGMAWKYLTRPGRFCPTYPLDPHFSDFATDVGDRGYEPAYTFIEPNYGIQVGSQFSLGDSQHPLGLVSAGESLIKHVYEALRNSPLWDRSALLILWDEHGGFYDHVPPPAAVPPADASLNRPTDGFDPGFAFDRLGVRVPALLVSSLAPRGRLGSELFHGLSFDHSAVIKSTFENFALGAPLTDRDAAAPNWLSCLGGAARSGANVPVQLSGAAASLSGPPTLRPPLPPADIDGFLSGMALVSLDLDRTIAERTGRASIANLRPQKPAEYEEAKNASLKNPHFRLQVAQYISEVSARAQAERIKAVATT